MSMKKLVLDGVWYRNAALVRILGVAPLIAACDTFVKAFTVSAVLLCVLVFCALFVSLTRHLIPIVFRLPVYALVLAAAVTCLDDLAAVYAYELTDALGIYIPVIAGSALVFSRLEEFASKHDPIASIVDAIGYGLGFLGVAVLVGMGDAGS